MNMPERIQQAMQSQVEAERRKRAAILESEGQRAATINVAEGEKRARILASEANLQERVNEAEGKARAIVLEAEARRKGEARVDALSPPPTRVIIVVLGLAHVAESLSAQGGQDAAALAVAEQYVRAFGRLAQQANTLIVPANASDANSMVAQAMTVYRQLSSSASPTTPSPPSLPPPAIPTNVGQPSNSENKKQNSR